MWIIHTPNYEFINIRELDMLKIIINQQSAIQELLLYLAGGARGEVRKYTKYEYLDIIRVKTYTENIKHRFLSYQTFLTSVIQSFRRVEKKRRGKERRVEEKINLSLCL